jgi:molecular chaperone DnaK
MKELFGDDRVLVHERPMLAIAEGAAILAHRLAEVYECPGCGDQVAQSDETCPACGFDLIGNIAKTGVVDIVHTTAHDYFLELEDGSGHLLARKDTPLPLQTQGRFRLMHPEQRLAHFRFHNTVNDVKESIGDLWLAFDLPEEEPAKEASEVLLDFEIDDNNLISVSARLADRPNIQVSRTLSRGQADEKRLLELEGSIARVNEAELRYFTKHDFLHRCVGIARAINRVIDPETGQENPDASEEAARLQAVADEMTEKNQSALGNIYYAEDFVESWGRFIKESERRTLEDKLRTLKDRYEQGSVGDILKARDELDSELDEHPALLALEHLDNVAYRTAKEDPAKAPRYERYLEDLRTALLKGDSDTFRRLLNEIMPEVDSMIGAMERRELHIWKEIRK